MEIVKKLEERDYRALEKDSYSSLKEFYNNRWFYYQEFVLGEKKKKELTDDMMRGLVLETMAFEPELFEDKFLISTVVPPNEGTNMYKFVLALMKRTIECTVEGQLTRTFLDIMVDAYNDVGIKKPGVETFIKQFMDSDALVWYTELRDAERLIVVSPDLVNACERNKEPLLELIERETKGREMLVQRTWEWEYNDLPMKMMADVVFLDHRYKRASPYDLKSTWEPETFKNYLKNKYYIQAAVYDSGLQHMLGGEWTVEPMRFICSDSRGLVKPVIHQCSPIDLNRAYSGFYTKNGLRYKGFRELVQEVLWHKMNGIWDCAMDVYMNGGVKMLDIKYE